MQEETKEHLFWEYFMCHSIGQNRKVLKDNNYETNLTHYRISFGVLYEISMINFIIVIAKYCTSASQC